MLPIADIMRQFVKAGSAQQARRALLGLENAHPRGALAARERKAQLFLELQHGKAARGKRPAPGAIFAAQELERLDLLDSAREFSMTASTLLRANHWQEGLYLLADRMPSIHLIPDVVAWNASIAACAAGAHWAGALHLWSQRRKDDPECNAFSATLDACGKASHWRLALALFTSDPSRSNLAALAVVVRACARGEQWSLALQALAQGEGASPAFWDKPGEGIAKLLEALLGALARASRWEQACALLLESNACVHGRISLNATLSACAEAARWEKALCLLQQSPSLLRLHPDTVHANCGLHALARAARWDHALQLLTDMNTLIHVQPDVASFSIAMTACEKGGRSGHALQLFAQLRESGLQSDAVGLGACVSASEKAARWATALHLLAFAQSAGHADSVSRNAAISACEKGARWELALNILARMHEEALIPGPVGHGALLGALSRTARWAEAMRHLVDTRDGHALDAVCLTSALNAFEQAGLANHTALAALQLKTFLQLEIAAKACRGTAANRAHGASTGALSTLQTYGLLNPVQVLRRRACGFAFRELQLLAASCKTAELSSGVRSSVLQGLCDLGGPCTRDASEGLVLRSNGQLSDWQRTARISLTASLSLPLHPMSTWDERQALLFGALPAQPIASRIVVWTCPELRGPANLWKITDQDQATLGEVTHGRSRRVVDESS
eukprot:TRINITY_DN17642_c1_g1_i1.p1 TRINITY_DN17642_c1_g1~~TRINITY_DN17642_c1_g1_i1.p1  ORF type:complete len:682 (-),score=98.82 TRINITY_DN17642_c1_g1_i1:63-2108(-)